MALSLISAYLIYLITCLLMKWIRFSFTTFFRCHVSLLSLSSIYSVPQILPMNVFESKWILVIAAENFLFRILNKKINIAQKKKRKLIYPFQFPILFSLSPLPILAFENVRCRKCLSSNFLKSYHFKANINNTNKIKTISGSEKLHSSEKNIQQRWKRIRLMVTFTTIHQQVLKYHQVFPLRFTARQADILEYYSQVSIIIKMIRVISASFLFSQKVFFLPTQFKKNFRI